MKHRAFYFGCYEKSGHFLWDTTLFMSIHSSSDRLPVDFPCDVAALDGYLLPQKFNNARQGVAFLSLVNGWTIISFNDNSVDKRPGSHSAFVISGEHSFDRALELSRNAFPQIFARFDFEIENSRFSAHVADHDRGLARRKGSDQ